MSEILLTSITTPIGPFSLAVESGVVIESTFGSTRSLRSKGRKVNFIPGVSIAIRRYFSGDLSALDSIPVDPRSNGFRSKVLKEMRKIKPSKTLSYQSLASRAGSPRASRAVGSACATNPIPLIIPCHRVVPSQGGIGIYGYGSDKKEWLLEFEGAISSS